MIETVTYQWERLWWGRLVSETGVKLYLRVLFYTGTPGPENGRRDIVLKNRLWKWNHKK